MKLVAALDAAARAESRSRSNFIQQVLTDWYTKTQTDEKGHR
jgi:metal-responsive CopG/Arc/MetJ family transcriptional regulator